ncbi:MAG TPA: LamG-like jellyroll fold domain-containing protein [Candidatus Binatia bacterium]|jgi:hypothetical protein|nr:LamG-like jellyroll fold domain-containing protein [Candidatus Binatia bacterium]
MKTQRPLTLTQYLQQTSKPTTFIAAAATAFLLAWSSPVSAAQVGLKLGLNGNGGLLPTTTAGALTNLDLAGAPGFAQTNWNNLGRYGNGVNPIDENGTNSGLTVNWDANNIWSQQGGGNPTPQALPDNKLMNAYDDSTGTANNIAKDGTIVTGVGGFSSSTANKPWMYIQGLSAWLAGQGACSYDVVIYVAGDTTGRIGQYWVENATGAWTSMTIGPNLTPFIFIREITGFAAYAQVPTTSNTGAGAASGTYAVFPGLTADSILLRSDKFNTRSPINAVQIIPHTITAPSFNYPAPPSQTNAAGTTASFFVPASGCSITYQWQAGAIGSGVYTNLADGGNLFGSATPTLTITNLQLAQTADYALVAANGSGTITNVTTLVVQPAIITTQPQSEILYPSGTAHFLAAATGVGTLTYQWQTNGVALTDGPTGTGSTISGSATNTLLVSNVGSADAANYTLMVTSSYGAVTSVVATLSLLATPAVGSFAESVVTNHALAYWRLGELSGSTAYDNEGGLNGAYLANSTPGQPGPQPTDFLGFDNTHASVSVNAAGTPVDQSWVTIPALNLNTNAVSIVAWVNLTFPQQNWAGILTCRHGSSQAGFNFSDTKNELVYTWNNNTTFSYHSGLIVGTNMWSMVALVVTPTNATFYCGDTNGLRSAFITLSNKAEVFNGTGTLAEDDTYGLSRALEGYIDDVAVFTHSLSTLDITRLYSAGRAAGAILPPTIVTEPSPQDLYPGRPAAFTVVPAGLPPITYQWRTNGVNLTDGGRISGSTNATLTVANVQASDAANYDVIVSNPGGSITSSIAPLTLTAPTGAGYEAAVIAAAPYAYWRLNETLGSTYAFDNYGGFTATYGPYSQTAGQGTAGPDSPDFPGFEVSNTGLGLTSFTAGSDVAAPPLNLNTNTVTITAWLNPLSQQTTNYVGLVFQRQGLTVAGLNFGNTMTNLGYTWNNLAGANNWNSGLTPPINSWSFAALVVEPTRATLYLYNTNNGQAVAVNTLNHPIQPFAGITYLGTDPFYAGGVRTFEGVLDEVAVWNRALSGDQIAALYSAASGASFPPVIALQPSPLTLYKGLNGQLTMTAAGSGPLHYQWLRYGTNISDGGDLFGTGTNILNITNAAFADAGTYSVVVTNSLGSVTSSIVALTVLNTNARPVFSAPASIASVSALTNQAGILVGAATFGATEYVVSVTNSATVLNYDFKADGSVATTTGNGTATGAFGKTITGYTNTTGNSNYDLVLGEFSNDGGPKTLTVNGLVPGRSYSLQLIALDDRDTSGGQHREQSRRAFFQDPYNATNLSSTFYMSNNFYVKATFTAASTNQLLFEQLPGWADGFTDVGNGALQAVVVRDTLSTPAIVQQPQSTTRYLGEGVGFKATGYGAPPVNWQWQRGSGGVFTNLPNSGNITQAVLTAITFTNPAVAAADAADYRLILTNTAGAATSQVATLTVLPSPPANSYEAAVLSYGPLAYWQLDETGGSLVAHDYAGGYDGSYGSNCINGVAGPPNPPFTGFEPGDLAAQITGTLTQSWVTVPALNLNTNTVTLTAWINPSGITTQADWSGIFFTRIAGTAAGFHYGGANQNNSNMLAYTWNGNSAATYGFRSQLTIPSGQWSFVALALSPTNAALYLINVGGVQTTNNAINHNNEVWAGVANIGNDPNGLPARTFNGSIDDVAVFKRTLSSNDVVNLSSAVPLAPPASAPTGLTATAGNGQVTLTWNGVPETDSYNLKRSTVSGGPYTTVISNITTLSIADTSVVNGTLYYYVVSAVNLAGQSGNSAEASARPVSFTRPQISFVSTASQVQLTWPVDHTGYRLQAQTNAPGVGLTTNWVAVPGSTTNNTLTFPLDGTQGSVFFRLVYP